jgi:Flp pilus assembly protein TadG
MTKAWATGGQALVEFAMSALIMLLLILGAVEFSRIMLVYTTLADAARLGARYAITHGTVPGGATVTCGPAGSLTSALEPILNNFLAAGTVNTKAAGFSINTTCPGATTPGNLVQVTVSYPYDVLIPYFRFPLAGITLASTSQGVITW